MISFYCSLCGMKFQVKPEFAGRSSRCPTCKQPLVVPPPSQTQADVAAGEIEGTSSSLAQAGVDGGGLTLEQASPTARANQKSVQELLALRTKKDGRYLLEQEIARGGMGVVLRAVDCDIRREVAVKYLLDQANAGKKLRFMEEAQITGQLEHPNIVPIHELGVDSLKRLFFSMKMVKGRSLAQVLDELRQQPQTAEKEYSLGKLLNILVSVCNALAYAHSCGVVHRDLKPANIMIGDFGEVYVMDWGLAKVLKRGAEAPAPMATVVTGVAAAAPSAVPLSQSISTKRSSKVETSRQPEADLTQEGAVLGTPVYMPPEQATGKVEAIDQRSDVYSLGAILYEMLTLQPPVDKEGGYLAILMRVVQGEIVPPEQRARNRTIPKELSAIVMKALAKNPQNRYPTVEALRKDIERFQEGRSVSAKEDTYREAVWRLVKRNKALSAATAVLVVVLVWSSLSNYLARRQIQDRTKNAVPALVKAARFGIVQHDFQNALEQVDLALTYADSSADARLLKGQLLILDKKFAEAGTELDKYLRQQPADAQASRLRELCARSRPDEQGNLLAIAQVFEQQKIPALADGLLTKHGGNSFEARQKLLKLYQDRIEKAWPGLKERLTMDAAGIYTLNLDSCPQVINLAPLEGMPLTSLNLARCRGLQDLTPLKDMPLTSLNLFGCGQVKDLTPLKGMPLTRLDLLGCGQVKDLTPLKGMPLTWLNLWGCGQVKDLTPLKGMPLTWLSLESCGQVQDLTPLRGMPLTWLNLVFCGQVWDLTPLQGMPLTTLNLGGCGQMRDLTPLQGLPLTWLNLAGCGQMRDLTPLQGLPLTWLNLAGCGQVVDLTPLQGLKLTEVRLTPKNITKGMAVLRQMKSLKTISIGDAEQHKFAANEFWRKYDAGDFNK